MIKFLNNSFWLLTLLFLSNISFSQTQFRHHVRLYGTPGTRADNVDACPKNYIYETRTKSGKNSDEITRFKGGDTLHITYEKTIDDITYRHDSIKILTEDSIVYSYTDNYKLNSLKLEEKYCGKFLGLRHKRRYNANIHVSNDTLYFNFWLFRKTDPLRKTLNDPDTEYFLTLKNRHYVRYFFTNYEFGALTIPFRYRFGFDKDLREPRDTTLTVNPAFNTNINGTLFLGKRLGRIKYIYDQHEGMRESQISTTG